MKHPLKIILFDGSLHPPTFIYRLAVGLSKEHEVYILGFSGKPRKDKNEITYVSCGSAAESTSLVKISLKRALNSLLKKGNFKHAIKILGLLLGGKKKELQQQHFNQSIISIAPDILHVQWPSLLPWCEEFLEKGSPKIILSQRGYQTNVRPWVDPNNLNYLKKWYPKLAGIHSVSKAIAKVGEGIYHNPVMPHAVVYSGFQLSNFHTKNFAPREGTLNILSIGRPHWKKGYVDALRAVRLLKDDGVLFSYSIVGAHEDEELVFLIDQLGLQNEVQLLKKTSQENVYKMIKATDLFLLPSLEEGLPNVLIEAMLLGTPVVATHCGGVAELVDDSTGFLVALGEPRAIYEGIKKFVQSTDQELLKKIENAQSIAMAQHGEKNMLDGMNRLYNEVLQTNLKKNHNEKETA
jgi:glycosyltransferase involved in cell wall biosynthesis